MRKLLCLLLPVLAVLGLIPSDAVAADAVRIDAVLKAGQVRMPDGSSPADNPVIPIAASDAAALAASVPAVPGMDDAFRGVAATATTLFVATVWTDGATSAVRMDQVDRATKAVTSLISMDVSRDGNGSVNAAGNILGSQVELQDRAAGPECELACAGLGIAGGALYGAVACSGGGFVLAILCGIAGGMFAYGVTLVCLEQAGCNTPVYPAFNFAGPYCINAGCKMIVQVRNAGRTLSSISAHHYWYYPPSTCARKGTEQCSFSHNEYYSNGISRADVSQPFPDTKQYEWIFVSGQASWARCATQHEVSVTVQWTDFTFLTTGFQPIPVLQPAVDCPGYQRL